MLRKYHPASCAMRHFSLLLPASFLPLRFSPSFVVFAMLWVGATCPAADWAQWRGPFFNGSSDETGLPASWNPETESRATPSARTRGKAGAAQGRIVWSAPLPGQAGSTPVVAEGRVFLTSADRRNQNLYALCLDEKTGRILWSKTRGEAGRIVPYNRDAAPSPVAAKDRVWFLFGSGALLACDHAGNSIWERNLELDFGPFTHLFLYGASPLLYRDRLYLSVLRGDPGDERAPAPGAAPKPAGVPDSFLLCLDPETGKTLWKQDRPSEAEGLECRDSYATPVAVELPDGRAEIVLIGADYLTGHDWATGQENWRFNYKTAGQTYRQRVCPTPVVAEGLLMAVKPRYGAAFALPIGLSGRVPPDRVAWEYSANTPDVPSPLYYEGRLYLLHDKKGVLSCLDPQTGRRIWEGALGGTLYHASPVAADGKIYCMSLEGDVAAVRAGGEDFEVLFRCAMGGHPAPSSIAISGKRLFIRTEEKLTCIGAAD